MVLLDPNQNLLSSFRIRRKKRGKYLEFLQRYCLRQASDADESLNRLLIRPCHCNRNCLEQRAIQNSELLFLVLFFLKKKKKKKEKVRKGGWASRVIVSSGVRNRVKVFGIASCFRYFYLFATLLVGQVCSQNASTHPTSFVTTFQSNKINRVTRFSDFTLTNYYQLSIQKLLKFLFLHYFFLKPYFFIIS